MEALIDTHSHLYNKQFDQDRQEVLDRARNVGIERIYLPNVDETSIDAMLDLEDRSENLCLATMGMHPCSVDNDFEKKLYEIEAWFGRRAFVAVGEIGLDYYWDKTFVEQQKEALQIQLAWGRKFDIPVILHTRDSIDDTIKILQEKADDPKQHGVFHCFSGNINQAKRILELGFYLGIGGVLSFKNSGLEEVVKETGLDKLVLETDSPYLAPVPHRGKRNESAYTALVAEKLASILNLSVGEVRKITTENAKKLFKA